MRDQEIDVLRGYCIASMVFSHFASGSILSKLLHISPYFDGASGFVLLSGLVLGRVVKSRVNGGGVKHALKANFKRVLEIYLYHLLIVFLFVLFYNINSLSGQGMGFGSSWEMVENALLLKLAPSGGSVLRLYVILMLLLSFTIVLMAKGHELPALAGSVLLYFVARHYSTYFSFQAVYGDEGAGANWGGWQLLFVLAFWLGWNWTRLKLGDLVVEYRVSLLAWLFLALLASHYLRASEYGAYLGGFWFEKTQMGVGRLIYAFVVMAGLYALVHVLRPYLKHLLDAVAVVGVRSLDSYVLQAVVLAGIVLLPFSWSSIPNVYLACVVYVACYVWAKYKLLSKDGFAVRGVTFSSLRGKARG